jgi:hypothetical protein
MHDYLEPKYYVSEIYHDYEQCYHETMDKFKEEIEGNLVYVRSYPEVSSEKRFDYKDTVYQGHFRVMVKKLDLDEDTINIPSLGEAQ